MNFFSKLLRSLIVGSVAGIAIAMFTSFFMKQVFDRLEWLTYDMRYVWKFQDFGHIGRDKQQVEEDPGYGINIINIDDRSLQKLGVYWHWDRSFHAQMLRSLTKYDPGACVFDILFYETEDSFYQWRLDKLLQRAPVPLPDAERQSIVSTIDYDKQFIGAVAESKNSYLGLRMSNMSDYAAASTVQHKMVMAWNDSLHPSSALILPASQRNKVFNPGNEKPVIDGVFPALAQKARDIGYVNVVPDDDGPVRRLPLMFAFSKFPPVYLPISVRTCITLFGTPREELVFVPQKYFDIGKPFKITKGEDGRLACSYPHMTPEQVQAMLEHAQEIVSLTPGKSVDVSSLLRVGMDDQNAPYVDMYCGMFPRPVIDALNAASLDTVLRLAAGGEIAPAPGMIIKRSSDAEWTLSAPVGDGEWTLSRLDLQTIARVKPEHFAGLAPGDRKLLFFAFSVRNYNGTLVSSIPVLRGETLRQLCMTPWKTIADMPPKMRMDFGENVRIPIDKDNQFIISYFGNKGKPFPYFSYYDIMNDRVHGDLEGKIFIVGSAAADMFDIKSVPHDKLFPAVEIHASIINSIMTNTFVKRLEDWQNFVILVLVGIVIGVIGFALKPLPGGILSVLSVIGYFLVAMPLFETSHLWIEIARPVLTIILTFTSVMAYRYITEEKDRKFLQSTFKQYLSPDLIDIMYKKKQIPQLGGDEGVRTAYFTDIQGFSTFSEKLGSPTRLVELLNEYLTVMTDTLMAHLGTLDKYEGDAIIAFFGAPMPMQDHAQQACATALDMQAKLGDLRTKWMSEGDKWPKIVHEMRMRIGVNTGPIVTGNMGSRMRMNYTMMGDAVNLAARLESAAKQYGVYTMLSHYTCELVKNDFEVRELDKITVVGKSEPVVIFELMSKKGELTPERQKMVERYKEGLALYYGQKWDQALMALKEAEQQEPFRAISAKNMSPSLNLIKRCEEYKKAPPPPDWDGVFKLTSK